MSYPVDETLIWEEVSSIHRSGSMTEGSQVSDLLNFLVKEEVEGRGDDVDVYGIATKVLGKGEDFNPVKDASVRVLMFKLRAALELHYTITPDSPLRVDLPKRSYRVVLTPIVHETPEPEEASLVNSATMPSPIAADGSFLKRCRLGVCCIAAIGVALLAVLLFWFSQTRDDPKWQSYAYSQAEEGCAAYLPKVSLSGKTGTTDEIMFRTTLESAISTQPWVQLVSESGDCGDGAPEYRLEYNMVGAVDPMVVTRLVDDRNGEAIWGLTVETGDGGTEFDLAAAQVAYLSSSWNGEIVRDAMDRKWDDPKGEADLRCLLNGITVYLAGDGLNNEELQARFDCLEAGQARHPDDGIFSWAIASNRFEKVKGHVPTGGLSDRQVRDRFHSSYLKSRELSEGTQYFTMLQMQLCDFSTIPAVSMLIQAPEMRVDFPSNDVKTACGRIIDNAFPALRLDPDFLSLAVFTRLLLFGDLQESLDMFDRANQIYGRESEVFALPVWISEYQKGNFQHIKEMALSRSAVEISTYDYMIFMAAARKMQDRQFAGWAKRGLEQHNDITTLDQAMALVNNQVVSNLISDIANEGLTFAYDSKG